MKEVDLGGADLGGAYLFEADLRGARLGQANLSDADISVADLKGAIDVTGEYLEQQAKSPTGAPMPDGSIQP